MIDYESQVILIMDLAEKNGNAKSSVVDLLEKKDIRVRTENRDYQLVIECEAGL